MLNINIDRDDRVAMVTNYEDANTEMDAINHMIADKTQVRHHRTSGLEDLNVSDYRLKEYATPLISWYFVPNPPPDHVTLSKSSAEPDIIPDTSQVPYFPCFLLVLVWHFLIVFQRGLIHSFPSMPY